LSDFADAFTDRDKRAGGRFRHVVRQFGRKFDGHQSYPSVSLTIAVELHSVPVDHYYPSIRRNAIAHSKNFDTVQKIRVLLKENSMANQLADSARVVDSAVGCPEIPIIVGSGNARVVMWPGNHTQFRTLQIITLERGARTIRLSHGSDAVYYVMSGAGSIVDLASNEVFPLVEGSMVHVDAGDAYQFMANDDDDMKVLGGPCPADERLYADLAFSEGK
jgi:mannose-6-phosphate isomerase-like protein (cupin superfamily)